MAARNIAGKVALVTGSTSGIGFGIAKTLAAHGCNVLLNGFGQESAIQQAVSSIRTEHGVKVEYHPADLTSKQEIKDMFAFARSKLGDVDILVNNAGVQHVANVEDFPDDKWDFLLNVNLTSNFHTIKEALPRMKAAGYGRIINVSSAHGKVASMGKSAYVAAKHGVLGLTKVVGLETAGTGVTCNAICPGWVLTPLVQAQIEARAKAKGTSVEDETLALLSEKQPSKQFVYPEDIGELAAFLCSPAAAQITAASISIDGGWTAI